MKNDVNESGHKRRSRSDNDVIKSPGSINLEGRIVDYDMKTKKWSLDNKTVGPLSELCKNMKYNKETHQLGFKLEDLGFEFKVPFKETSYRNIDDTSEMPTQSDYSTYTPTKSDIELILSDLSMTDENLSIGVIFDKIEEKYKQRGIALHRQWRDITKHNIKIWFK